PRALLRQSVGVLPCQRVDERGLAVVDMTRGADRQRHVSGPARTEDGARGLVDLGLGQRPRVEQQPSVTDNAEHRWVAEPEWRGELLLDRARGARQLGERERSAADARDRLLHLAADEPGETLGPLAHALERLVEHAKDGNLR